MVPVRPSGSQDGLCQAEFGPPVGQSGLGRFQGQPGVVADHPHHDLPRLHPLTLQDQDLLDHTGAEGRHVNRKGIGLYPARRLDGDGAAGAGHPLGHHTNDLNIHCGTERVPGGKTQQGQSHHHNRHG